MTEKELEEIEKRVNAATPAPWVEGEGCVVTPVKCEDSAAEGHNYCIVSNDAYDGFLYLGELKKSDIIFIAHAREDIPKLTAEIRRLKKF